MCSYLLVDMFEVNGLTVDWVSSHIYWTDGRKKTIEVSSYDGSNHHILSIGGLQTPRGIVVDPIKRSVSTWFHMLYDLPFVLDIGGVLQAK